MNLRFYIVLTYIALFARPTPLEAATIVGFSIDDTAGLTANTLATGVTSTDLTSPAWTLGIANNDFINIPESAGMQDGTADNMDGAFTAGQFLEFEISTTSSPFQLDELQMTLERGSQGPQDYGVRISTDGFAGGNSDTGLAAFNLSFNQAVTTTAALETIDLSVLTLVPATDITFRIAYDDRINNTTSSSAGRFYDIAVTASAVPEPSSFAALILGFAGMLIRKRWRMKHRAMVEGEV